MKNNCGYRLALLVCGVIWSTGANARELITDRPDKTEAAYTVDLGRYQFETDIVSYTRDRAAGVTTERWAFNLINMKRGMTPNSDLQVLVESLRFTRTRELGATTRVLGFGDITVRFKQNLWGNDEGTTAFALMPFVRFATAKADFGGRGGSAGLIAPLAISLPNDWGLGLMAQFNRDPNARTDGHHWKVIGTAAIGHSIVGALGGYAEFFSQSSWETGAKWVVTADFGLTYGMTPDLQFDVGANVGVTDAADDLNPFVGVSWRI